MTVRLTLVAPRPLPTALVRRAEDVLGAAVDARALHGPGTRDEAEAGSAPMAGTAAEDGSTRHGAAWYGLHLRGDRADAEALAELREQCRAAGVDTAVAEGALATEPPALLVMDVDSTFFTGEVIEMLADHAGAGAAVAAVTERAMRGELDFAASLRERVATLEGLPESVLDEVRSRVELTPGAAALVRAVHDAGGLVGLVSGGFVEVVTPVAAALGVDHVRANALEVADGRLTGRTTGPVVDRAAKAHALHAWAAEAGVPVERTVAVGDGANDLDMLAAAGMGVAFCAKPVLRRAADAAVRFPRLDAVGALAGLW